MPKHMGQRGLKKENKSVGKKKRNPRTELCKNQQAEGVLYNHLQKRPKLATKRKKNSKKEEKWWAQVLENKEHNLTDRVEGQQKEKITLE